MRLESIDLENFRSFRGQQTIHLKPITFLVGENSAGKTTFLAALSSMTVDGIASLAFLNQEPYRLAGYRSLASDGESQFSIGFRLIKEPNEPAPAILVTKSEFRQDLTKTVLSRLDFDFPEKLSGTFTRRPRAGGYEVEISSYPKDLDAAPIKLGGILSDTEAPNFQALRILARNSKSISKQVLTLILDSVPNAISSPIRVRRPISISPIRAKPLRLYEASGVGRTPDGDHFPHRLRELQSSKSGFAKSVRQKLQDFGERSGMFRRLKTKQLRSISGDSFELTVEMNGVNRTLLDVGYGVSQVLPVVTDVASAAPGSFFLIQQPEVHLHPKSQAELSSFFIDQYKVDGKTFVIETHSDYIIDRARLEVKRGRIRGQDVSVLFFTNTRYGTQVIPISINEHGDFVDAPTDFRSFFLEEQRKILGWE